MDGGAVPDQAGGQVPYDAAYYATAYGDAGLSRLTTHWWANRFYARIAERLLRRTGGNRLLDAGCGQGLMLAHLKPWVDAWGAEVSDYGIERCARFAPRARVLSWNMEEDDDSVFGGERFDVVVARYVLEHIHDPERVARKLAGLVKPGGYLLAAQPNMESIGRRLKGQEWYAFKDPTHVSLLEPAEWNRIMAAAGLELEKVFSDGLWDLPYVKGIPGFLQYPIFSLPCIWATFSISTRLPLSWGENWIGIARKPL